MTKSSFKAIHTESVSIIHPGGEVQPRTSSAVNVQEAAETLWWFTSNNTMEMQQINCKGFNSITKKKIR